MLQSVNKQRHKIKSKQSWEMYGVFQKVELKFGFSGHLGDNHVVASRVLSPPELSTGGKRVGYRPPPPPSGDAHASTCTSPSTCVKKWNVSRHSLLVVGGEVAVTHVDPDGQTAGHTRSKVLSPLVGSDTHCVRPRPSQRRRSVGPDLCTS